MASLFSLVEDLAARLASKSDGSSTQQEEDDPVMSRFKSVLPSLIDTCFLPDGDGKVKEREITAMAKLLMHTTEHMSAVLNHGHPHSVLPIVRYAVAVLGEEMGSACRDSILDIVISLVSLLHTGGIESFCRLVVDATVLLEDLASIGSFYANKVSLAISASIRVRCFKETFADGPLYLDIGRTQWQPVAEFLIRLLKHCLSSKAITVRGLIRPSFLHAVGEVMSCARSGLYELILGLFQISIEVLDADVIPSEKIVMSILRLLSPETGKLYCFRTASFDSVAGACLLSAYVMGQRDTVECTAEAFCDIFPGVVKATTSRDLKVAFCSIMSVILKHLPSYASYVLRSMDLMCIPEIVHPFSRCIQLALDSQASYCSVEPFAENATESSAKRRRLDVDVIAAENINPFEKGTSLLAECLECLADCPGSFLLDNLLAAFCVFSRLRDRKFDKHFRLTIMKQFCECASLLKTLDSGATIQLSILLEALDGLFFFEGSYAIVTVDMKRDVAEVLRWPWNGTRKFHTDDLRASKLQVLSTVLKVVEPDIFNVPEILRLGLEDEDTDVRSAALLSVLALAAHSTFERIGPICDMLSHIDEDTEKVRESLASVIGPMFCVSAGKAPSTTVCTRYQNKAEIVCNVCDEGCRDLNSHVVDPPFRWVLIRKLLFEDMSSRVQAALVRNLGRILSHCTVEALKESKLIWLECLEVFPLHWEKSIRHAFSGQIHCFLEERVRSCILQGSEGDLEILGKFRHALAHVEDSEVRETLIETVAEIAKAATNDHLRVFAIVLLTEQLDSRDMAVKVASVTLVSRFTASPQWLTEGVRKGLFEYLCGRLVNRPLLVKEFAEAVMQISLKDLLREVAPFVLPKLILEQQHDQRAKDTLPVLARQLGTTLPLMLLEFCHKILSVLLLRADGDELMTALEFYEAQTGSTARDIFVAVLPTLLDELVRYLGDVSTDEAFRRAGRVGPMIQEVARILCGSDDLPNFLKDHFVGLLNSIDRKLLRSEDTEHKRQALRCIERLLDMIGSYLSAFVPKIMALLSHAVQQDQLQCESFQVWLAFVRRLGDVSPVSLKSVARQIVVALMPCLESEDKITLKGAVEILEELIVKHKATLGDQIRELPILPSVPSLSFINNMLAEERGPLVLREQLNRARDSLMHENLSVRYAAATELRKVLASNRMEVTNMVLGEAALDADAVSSLVTALLRGCAEEARIPMSQKFRLACAECLGELGAIDPVKLHVSLRRRCRMSINDEDFVFELISSHLARVLRAASETDIQDAAALSIQELLKIFGCHEAQSAPATKSGRKTKSAQSTAGGKMWSRFSEDVKEIITPCLTSKYVLKDSAPPLSTGPIFQRGISFRRWIYMWVKKLLSMVTGRRRNIFAACKGITRHDMNTALYLLPYLILDVLCHGSLEARAGISNEILTVLTEPDCVVTEAANSSPVLINNIFFGHGEVSTQAVFMLLDNLGQWVDDYKQGASLIQKLQPGGKNSRASNAQQMKEGLQECDRVQEFLAAISKNSLAGAAFQCRAYARALMYYESYVREKSGALNPAAVTSCVFDDEDIVFLLKIYGGLDEPDGFSGLARFQKCVTLQDQLFINEKSGNWAEALTCCEQALQKEPKNLSWQSGALNCLVNMGHFQAMATHVDGLIARIPEHRKQWSIRGVQAAWRLGQWDLLDEYVQGAESDAEKDPAFDLSLAKVLQTLRCKEHSKFAEQLTHSRLALLAPLAAACMESYTRAYPVIVKLHMLRELEDFFAIAAAQQQDMMTSLVENWNGRLKMTQPSLSAREPILALRRTLFSTCGMQSEVSACWLQYAKLCRSSGHYETADRTILQAQAAGALSAHRERAKLLWDAKLSHRAFDELHQALAKVPLTVLGTASNAALGRMIYKAAERADFSENADATKALLLLGRWAHETGQKQKEDVISIYTRVTELQPNWEKGYFYMAKYFDDIVADAKQRQDEAQGSKKNNVRTWWHHLPNVMHCYARTLCLSHNHLFQALPRLLTLWFEFGSMYVATKSNSHLHGIHSEVMQAIEVCVEELPTYQWLAALPQLVSRICHNNSQVVRQVKRIIAKVLRAYPGQALWTMAAVSKSTVSQRRAAAEETIRTAKHLSGTEAEKLVYSQFTAFIEQLIALCFVSVPDSSRSFSLTTTELSCLKRAMPLSLVMPTQRALAATLPADGLNDPNYNPFFSGDCCTISAIRDEVEVLVSLQRPKKVVLIASDGTEHPFLCKPKDDLRKDARMMEFTTMLNRLLSKDPSSRRRKLYIRTFSVIPLTEDCGMVEWVSHTRAARHILQDLYAACGKFDKQKTNGDIKALYDACDKSKLSRSDLLREKLLPKFPPIFHRWFLNTFPEPTAWFQARLAYAHTAAVWSMVGHIVGLGDRHGENILFDATTGDCVHVDFSCLFDRGLMLQQPELVPFRLTQNMVDGLGITGVEGVFIRTCEIALSVLRNHRETLMSVLETFIHDPLVEWTKQHKMSSTEVQNPHAQRALANIDARLKGVVVGVRAAPSLPLSVEGQVNRLVADAVSHDNLSQMYIWWMPWF